MSNPYGKHTTGIPCNRYPLQTCCQLAQGLLHFYCYCADISTDVRNCGTCGNDCSSTVSNAITQCSDGKCGLVNCNTGYGNCDDDDTNGCEADFTTDTSNCGRCGHGCSSVVFSNAMTQCSNGTCGLGSCKTGFGNCDGNSTNGCEADLTTATSCGACNNNQTTACANVQSNICSGTACAPGQYRLAPGDAAVQFDTATTPSAPTIGCSGSTTNGFTDNANSIRIFVDTARSQGCVRLTVVSTNVEAVMLTYINGFSTGYCARGPSTFPSTVSMDFTSISLGNVYEFRVRGLSLSNVQGTANMTTC